MAELLEAGLDREAAERGASVAAHAHDEGGRMDPLTQLDQLAPALAGVVSGIGRDDLGRPTPCNRFAVGDVLAHMVGGARQFAAAFRGEAPPPDTDDDALDAFPSALGDLASAVNAPGALERTVATPFGDLPGETFARFVVLDGLVHGWDLATATGQPYEPPDDLVAEVDAFARSILDPLRDGDTFGDSVEPTAGATPIERLAAFTGRRPLVDVR